MYAWCVNDALYIRRVCVRMVLGDYWRLISRHTHSTTDKQNLPPSHLHTHTHMHSHIRNTMGNIPWRMEMCIYGTEHSFARSACVYLKLRSKILNTALATHWSKTNPMVQKVGLRTVSMWYQRFKVSKIGHTKPALNQVMPTHHTLGKGRHTPFQSSSPHSITHDDTYTRYHRHTYMYIPTCTNASEWLTCNLTVSVFDHLMDFTA